MPQNELHVNQDYYCQPIDHGDIAIETIVLNNLKQEF
jgi:3'-phosphoadenosine 5'-phosphosulfate (PAPS) 3'-phosphatase